MFQFPRFPLAHPMDSGGRDRASPRPGCPIRDIRGSTPADGSPRLFAAFHALHRLVTPRHPPCALLRSTPTPRADADQQDRWRPTLPRPWSGRQAWARPKDGPTGRPPSLAPPLFTLVNRPDVPRRAPTADFTSPPPATARDIKKPDDSSSGHRTLRRLLTSYPLYDPAVLRVFSVGPSHRAPARHPPTVPSDLRFPQIAHPCLHRAADLESCAGAHRQMYQALRRDAQAPGSPDSVLNAQFRVVSVRIPACVVIRTPRQLPQCPILHPVASLAPPGGASGISEPQAQRAVAVVNGLYPAQVKLP